MPRWTKQEQVVAYHNYYHKLSVYTHDDTNAPLIKGIKIRKALSTSNLRSSIDISVALNLTCASARSFLDKLSSVAIPVRLFHEYEYYGDWSDTPVDELTLSELQRRDYITSDDSEDSDSDSQTDGIYQYRVCVPAQLDLRGDLSFPLDPTTLSPQRKLTEEDFRENSSMREKDKYNFLNFIHHIDDACHFQASTYYALCEDLNISDLPMRNKVSVMDLYRREILGVRLGTTLRATRR